tara:strand:- start:35752 stop:36390 length:639 start_codon:yes stop_codon:yes gene_type:complete
MNTKKIDITQELQANDIVNQIDKTEVNQEWLETNIPIMWKGEDFINSDSNHFRLKIGALSEAGKLHMQFGAKDVEALHSRLKKELISPYVYLSGKMTRAYGLAFDLNVKTSTIDSHQLKELGHKVAAAGVSVSSLAQASDYCLMEFIGVEDGEDNLQQPCKMLVFELAPECRVYIRFSDLSPTFTDVTKSMPEYRVEWLLAWLCANYLMEEE